MLETIATSGAPGSWTEITARVLPEGLEPLSDILTAFSGGGVAIEPAIDALGPDEGYTLDEAPPSPSAPMLTAPCLPAVARLSGATSSAPASGPPSSAPFATAR